MTSKSADREFTGFSRDSSSIVFLRINDINARRLDGNAMRSQNRVTVFKLMSNS